MKPRPLPGASVDENLLQLVIQNQLHAHLYITHTQPHTSAFPQPRKGVHALRGSARVSSPVSQELKENMQGTRSKSQEQGRATLRGEVLLLPSSCSFHQTALLM